MGRLQRRIERLANEPVQPLEIIEWFLVKTQVAPDKTVTTHGVYHRIYGFIVEGHQDDTQRRLPLPGIQEGRMPTRG